MSSTSGWILDAHLCSAQLEMLVWIVTEDGSVVSFREPWHPTLHVAGSSSDLEHLVEWLSQPELWIRYGLQRYAFERKRPELGSFDTEHMLALTLESCATLRALAEHIDARGEHVRYNLYSVDVRAEQQYLTSKRLTIGSPVWLENNRLSLLERDVQRRDWRCCRLEVVLEQIGHEGTLCLQPTQVLVTPCDTSGNVTGPQVAFSLQQTTSLQQLEQWFREYDPDLVLSLRGNTEGFPHLLRYVEAKHTALCLGRNQTPLRQIGQARILSSYGQVLRSDPQFPLEGRIHIDLSSSFMFREGGLDGLYELARVSATRISDASRKSPGSVISAIQYRIAMEDDVLVPWKKTRPEDTKSAWDLLQSDRGGLYLDSRPGVYANVIELDFASLFPSIIATRNISPETLNCSCCQPAKNTTPLPLHPDEAKKRFQLQQQQWKSASLAFPQQCSNAFQVPELMTHTCGRRHGFLGRVVAPLIERRRQLKQQIVVKGDAADRQQNALKWLLVTCFGYTGYRNARFGRIEAHEAICAWARELLLQTIECAQERGWEVLHAIVDSIWIRDREGRSLEEQHQSAMDLSNHVHKMTGIPLEYEATYRCIAFLPSRMHSGGSLTKYWAYGQKGMKIRGLELRQHSTCPWVAQLQTRALEMLADADDLADGIPSYRVQCQIQRLLLEEVQRLEQHQVRAKDLLIAQRISRKPSANSSQTVAMLAYQRSESLGYPLELASKVRFVVCTKDAINPLQRVVLARECEHLDGPFRRIDVDYYRRLAVRAIWSVLAPFGWSEEELLEPPVARLEQWM
ncbi:MAG: DNA polymerase domain-containing protein [Candidatus Thermoplasmatota archaeon]|nr:DNA polymerase domain-containing protein [Candidatus Thermoplasmatota archaeon]